jgi:hypothetical protein
MSAQQRCKSFILSTNCVFSIETPFQYSDSHPSFSPPPPGFRYDVTGWLRVSTLLPRNGQKRNLRSCTAKWTRSGQSTVLLKKRRTRLKLQRKSHVHEHWPSRNARKILKNIDARLTVPLSVGDERETRRRLVQALMKHLDGVVKTVEVHAEQQHQMAQLEAKSAGALISKRALVPLEAKLRYGFIGASLP